MIQASAATGPRLTVAVHFERLGPYHHARLQAAARSLAVTALETFSNDATYAWDVVSGAQYFSRLTLWSDGPSAPTRTLARRMFKALDRTCPSVVAIAGWSDPAALAALEWCAVRRRPAVVMSESQVSDEPRRGWKEAVKKRLIGLFSSGLVGGQPHAEYLHALGMNRDRIFTGYDVVNNQYFAAGAEAARAQAAEIRQELGLPPRYFLASARFVPKKNLLGLLSAYHLYRNRVGPAAWHLVILGDGCQKAEILRMRAALALTEWVLLPGFKQYAELPAFYGLAGAFLHASTTEQWGLVVNEAMAAGLPVLVSDRCGCVPELVQDGLNGYSFDPARPEQLAELLERLAASDAERVSMGRASREIINRWSPLTFAANLRKACETAISVGAPTASFADRILLRALRYR